MGKISKALEKRGKETTDSLKRQKIAKHDQANSELAMPEVHDKTQVITHERKKVIEDNHQQAMHRSTEETSTKSYESESIRKSDAKNISLVKPGEMEQQYDSHDQRKVVFHGDSTLATSRKPDSGKRVMIEYSKTKVQASDPERLKNGNVLSLFEDMETTNQFKILRTQVLRKLKAIGGNSILVTSANPCEGKTFTSINLGVSIAKEFDKTVLIIDADIRRPLKEHTDFATEFFHLQVNKGLTDFLEGEAEIEDILINPGIDKLTLIPGGMPVDNSPELLNSARMEMMMDEIKNRYPEDRLVILDGPAILHFPDAMILYRYVDGVLPVIESEKTSTEQVKKMMEYLQEVNILGAVLNKNKG